eukprot:5619950-Lingulodinium_polyedra.AAC.1
MIIWQKGSVAPLVAVGVGAGAASGSGEAVAALGVGIAEAVGPGGKRKRGRDVVDIQRDIARKKERAVADAVP